jgi:DNA-binding XRE family transcriptional regulator
MTNTSELEAAIARSGKSKNDLASKLGLARETLWKKINNMVEFKAGEILALQQLLHLSSAKRDAIFFDKKGDK